MSQNHAQRTQEEALDYVERKLMELIDEGHFPAIRFFLENMGHHRGWADIHKVKAHAQADARREEKPQQLKIQLVYED